MACSACEDSMSFVTCDIQDAIATVTLHRPEVHNAFNDALIAELTETFRALADDTSVRVVVLAGEGKSFCAGADLKWMGAMKGYSMAENEADSRKLAELFHTINICPKSVIGVVQGAAMGGGVGLVAVCDYVLATEGAKFGLTEVQLGLVPAVISPFVVAKMGESNARAWFLSGNRFDGVAAMRMGLVHELVTDESALQTRLPELVRGFLRAAPKAVAEAKKLIADVLAMAGDAERQIAHTSKVIARLRVADEGQEGMDALLNKTKPNWNKG